KAEKTPILFKIKEETSLYGCVENEKWRMIKIPFAEVVNELPFLEKKFQTGFMERKSFTPELINILKRGHFFSQKTKFECNAIHLAVMENQLEIVKELLKEAPELLNKKDYFRRTPLFLAVKQGHVEIVNYLIQQDVDLANCMPPTGVVQLDGNQFSLGNCRTILALACKGGNIDIVKLLWEKSNDQKGQVIRAFITAIYYGYLHVVKFFLENKPALLLEGYYPDSLPLSVALSKNHHHIANYFFEKNSDLLTADYSLYNAAGQLKKIGNIIPIAHEADQKEVIAYISEKYPDLIISSVCHRAANRC
ncbi:MAG: ankyrin repeat domain-containing protein, partial [Gammaproteobacteria bacterium]|nr:ankyrin repeat domain-containing protein [Gammaproteobacteria bacterium]